MMVAACRPVQFEVGNLMMVGAGDEMGEGVEQWMADIGEGA